MDEDNRLIKSYVWHKGKCFFVSTIDRDSSALEGGRYAETMVWDFDWQTNRRGNIVGQDGGPEGSIKTHCAVCQRLKDAGQVDEIEAED